jgi:hypothetical protein
MTRCHAGARHLPALCRGPFGELCDDCWAAVFRVLERFKAARAAKEGQWTGS